MVCYRRNLTRASDARAIAITSTCKLSWLIGYLEGDSIPEVAMVGAQGATAKIAIRSFEQRPGICAFCALWAILRIYGRGHWVL